MVWLRIQIWFWIFELNLGLVFYQDLKSGFGQGSRFGFWFLRVDLGLVFYQDLKSRFGRGSGLSFWFLEVNLCLISVFVLGGKIQVNSDLVFPEFWFSVLFCFSIYAGCHCLAM